MEALGIVDGVDEVSDGAPGFRDVLEVVGTRLFGLQRLHEAFGLRIVVRERKGTLPFVCISGRCFCYRSSNITANTRFTHSPPRRLSGMSRKATLARDLLGWFLL